MRIFLLCCLLVLTCCLPVEAAKEGAVMDKDFAYKGITLGDTEEDLVAEWGEIPFDKRVNIFGTMVKRCDYGDISVSIALNTKKVVDIKLAGKDYKLRNGVRYGATAALIKKTYGHLEKQMLEGVIYYVYQRPEHPHQHLLIETDSGNGSLVSVRITSLPLTVEEADEMVIDGSDIEQGLELEDLFLNEKDIDLSGLPEAEEPVLVLEGME